MKNELTTIGNKTYKESAVVMLAVKKHQDYLHLGLLYNDELGLSINTNAKIPNTFFTYEICEPQHLYFLSNDYVNLGDWYYTGAKTSTYGIHQADSERLVSVVRDAQSDHGLTAFKVIASTDTALNIQFGHEVVLAIT